jgi:Zn-dependent protease
VEPDQDQRAPAYPPGSIRIGSIGGIAVLVRGSWLVVALLIAWLLAPTVDRVQPGLGGWKYLAGLAYAVLLYLTVLLHEMSHALMAKHYGLGVRWITLSFLGGMTTIDGEPGTPRQQFRIAVVGPITSIAVGAAFYALHLGIHDGVLGLAVAGMAVANLVIGVLNLIPGLPLDGGRVLQAVVWKTTGNSHRGTIVAAWAGRVVAVLALFWPLVSAEITDTDPDLLDYALAWVVAAFLWGGASAAISSVRIRSRLPALQARALARRVIAVPGDLSIAEATRRANEAQAGGIVVHSSDDQVSGLVSEASLAMTPEDRRPWVAVTAVARSIEDGLVLPIDIAGEDLVRALNRTPATEYLLVEADGSIHGMLSTRDVDQAFANGVLRERKGTKSGRGQE